MLFAQTCLLCCVFLCVCVFILLSVILFCFQFEKLGDLSGSGRFSGAWIRSWHNANTSPLSTGWSVTANTRALWMSTMTSILQSLSLSGQRRKRSYKKRKTLQRLCSLWGRWVASCEGIGGLWAVLHFLTASTGFWPYPRPNLMDTASWKKGKKKASLLGDARLSCI